MAEMPSWIRALQRQHEAEHRNGTPSAQATAEPGHDHGDAWEPHADRAEAPADASLTLSLGRLLDRHPALRPPVIHGLLRRGETMNIISLSKVGKSWLVNDLVLAVATGSDWLGSFATEQGRVLLIDNELHHETLADRLKKVAAARGIAVEAVRDAVDVLPLRGRLRDLHSLREYFLSQPPDRYRVVVLDSFYRGLPPGMSENDNAAMAAVYNAVDAYAEHMGSCFVNIHHASKGNQSDKAVTDVGSGAGSQSRATDTHLILRPHEEEGVYVLEAAVRSWAPVEPVCLRWEFPVWRTADDLDPELLLRPQEKQRKAAKEAREKQDGTALLNMLDQLDPDRRGCGVNRLRQALTWGRGRMEPVVGRLLREEILVSVRVPYLSGRGTPGECDGVRRRPKG